MTVEERLAVVETEIRGLKGWMESNDGKLDQLIAVTNMGKGAWLLLLKVGGVLAAGAAVVAWVFDKFHK